MNSFINNMPKYDHRQHVLSDWLAELGQRFQLGEVGEDKNKITWCQLLIGTTGSSILSGLDDEAQGWLQGYVIGGGLKANLTNSHRSMLRFDQLESVNVEV